MTLDEVLNRWIPYRLQTIDTLRFAMKLTSEPSGQRLVEVVVDGKVRLRGNVELVTNPMIEIGLIHARALLEFLGLRAEKGKLAQIGRRKPDDIAIECFIQKGMCLSKVSPTEALAAYLGPKDEAEAALVAIFEWTNKSIAHLTTGELSAEYTDRHLDIAIRGIRALLHNQLYAKLGVPIPTPPGPGIYEL